MHIRDVLGGPGCSAMEGAFTEIGPLILYEVKNQG